MKNKIIIVAFALVMIIGLGSYSYVSANEDNNVLKENVASGQVDNVEIKDRNRTLTAEELEKLQKKQMEKAINDFYEQYCENRGCTREDFKPVAEEDIISKGIIDENGSREIIYDENGNAILKPVE